MSIKYTEPKQCPCCGHQGKLVMNMSSSIVEGWTTGSISGVGVGLGCGGVGVGVGRAGVNLQSTSGTRLQHALDLPEIEPPSYASMVLKSIVSILVLSSLYLFCFKFIASLSPRDADASDSLGVMHVQMGVVAEKVLYVILALVVIYVAYMIIKKLPAAFEMDAALSGEAEVAQKRLADYYETLRFCGECHVVYDMEGYAATAKDGVIEKLALQAGVFDDEEIKDSRSVNMRLR